MCVYLQGAIKRVIKDGRKSIVKAQVSAFKLRDALLTNTELCTGYCINHTCEKLVKEVFKRATRNVRNDSAFLALCSTLTYLLKRCKKTTSFKKVEYGLTDNKVEVSANVSLLRTTILRHVTIYLVVFKFIRHLFKKLLYGSKSTYKTKKNSRYKKQDVIYSEIVLLIVRIAKITYNKRDRCIGNSDTLFIKSQFAYAHKKICRLLTSVDIPTHVRRKLLEIIYIVSKNSNDLGTILRTSKLLEMFSKLYISNVDEFKKWLFSVKITSHTFDDYTEFIRNLDQNTGVKGLMDRETFKILVSTMLCAVEKSLVYYPHEVHINLAACDILYMKLNNFACLVSNIDFETFNIALFSLYSYHDDHLFDILKRLTSLSSVLYFYSQIITKISSCVSCNCIYTFCSLFNKDNKIFDPVSLFDQLIIRITYNNPRFLYNMCAEGYIPCLEYLLCFLEILQAHKLILSKLTYSSLNSILLDYSKHKNATSINLAPLVKKISDTLYLCNS